jgi:hypothetical protein
MWGSTILHEMKFLMLAIFCSLAMVPHAFGQSVACDAGEFRDAVSIASAAIVSLHEKNSKIFKEKLQRLHAANGWTDAEFVAKARPFVEDDVTASLDARNQALLATVQTFDAANARSEQGRCAMLSQFRSLLQKVVENTNAKWDHMISKISLTSGAALQAGAAP